jgi:nitroreductase
MDILPELAARRARRAISSETLDAAALDRIVEAATLAPSCFNNQPWRIVAVERGRAGNAYEAVSAALTPGNAWATEAPLLLIFCTSAHLDCRMDQGRDYAFFDLGQACLAVQLQAWREGFYAHPMAGFSPQKIKTALGLPPEVVPLCFMALGKPGANDRLSESQKLDETSERSRKPLSEVVFRDSWGRPWN